MINPLYLTFDAYLRSKSVILDNFFNYQFDKPVKGQAHTAPSLSLHMLTYPEENNHWVAYLAEKTRYRDKTISLSSQYSDEQNMLIFWSHGTMMHVTLTPEMIKKMRADYLKNRKDFDATLDDVAWLTFMLKTLDLRHGWANTSLLKTLEPTQREKNALVFLLAAPQVGFINSIAAFSVALAVLGTTLITPYYIYVCHYVLTVAEHKARYGGRTLSPEMRSIIFYDALAMGAQTFVVTAYASFMLHSHYLELPSVYESIQAVLGRFKPLIINGIPLDVHLAMIITSGIVIGGMTLYVTWLRNHDNPNFKSRHYGYTVALGFMIGFCIYAATMMPGLGQFMSETTFAGFAEGAAILMYGAGLHLLANSTARPELGNTKAMEEQHGLIEPYSPVDKSAVSSPLTVAWSQHPSKNPVISRARSLSCTF